MPKSETCRKTKQKMVFEDKTNLIKSVLTNKVVSCELSAVAISLNLLTGTEGTLFLFNVESLLVHEECLPPFVKTGSASDILRESFTASNNLFAVKYDWFKCFAYY